MPKFIDANIPIGMRQQMLDSLSFVDFVKEVYATSERADCKEMHAMLVAQFNKKRADDFAGLSEIKTADSLLTTLKTATPPEDTEREIMHLCFGDHSNALRIFSEYTHIINKNIINPTFVLAFLVTLQHIKFKKNNQVIVQIDHYSTNGWGEEDYSYSTYEYVSNWSALTTLILLNDKELTSHITQNYPQELPAIMKALNELALITEKGYEDCKYSKEHVNAVRLSLILSFTEEQSKRYILTFSDKRLLESYLTEEINKLSTLDAVNEFYKQYANAVFVNQHRLKSLSTQPFTQVKSKMLQLLDFNANRLKFFREEKSEPVLSADEKVTLRNAVDDLKGILIANRDKISKETTGISFMRMFSSSEMNENKLEALKNAITQLNNIENLSQLKMFTESLLVKTELVARRTVGITASDTYVSIKEYYDNVVCNKSAQRLVS
jgi:hypothetical protein